jgi:hypothetical protein
MDINGSPYGFCECANSAGTYKGCTTTLPAHLQFIESASNDSLVTFQADANGNCSYLSIASDSSDSPKKP